MLSADSYRAPVLLFLKAKGSIKDHPGFVLYGNPPRWHKFDPGKHTDAGQTHYHAKKQLEVKAAQQIASEGSHGHDGASPEDHVAKMKSLAKEPGVGSMEPARIQDLFFKRLYINYSENVKPANVKFDRRDNRY